VLEFRVLGPLEVLDDGRPLPQLPPKQRALLARLLLRAGGVVSRERLIDDVWGDEVPPTVIASLENAVSRLRKALGFDLVATRPPGYALAADPEQIDLIRFERLVAKARDGDHEARAARLREALALFRGPPLADVAYAPFAQVESARLEELEIAALEDLAAAELELGRDGEVVSELEPLIVEHPYRERLRALHMLGLYRSGRQADALAAYQQARRTLVDELGTEPTEELRELHRNILRQDPALRAPARASRRDHPGASEQRPRGPSRKTVTVLTCRLADWPVLAEQTDPEAQRTMLDRFRALARAGVARHGGTVDTVAHDVISAVFGVPAAHEDDALRALRAAVDVRAAVAAVDDDTLGGNGLSLQTRIGLGTGEVLVDPLADTLVTGSAVSLSEHLAHAAAAGEILLGETTQRLVRDAATLEVHGSAPRGATSSYFRLVEFAADAWGRDLRMDSPLVGRSRELEALSTAFESVVRDRRCRMFTVVGEPGVGKTRLVGEFVELLGARATVLQGRCLPYGERITFWPLLEAFRAGARAAEGPAQARIAEAVDLAAGSQLVQATLRATRTAFEELARIRPVVVAFDDLHWAEPTFLDLLENVAELSRGEPIFILCATRPELLDERTTWGGDRSSATFTNLEPLPVGECERLLDNLLGESDLPKPVRTHIVTSADGNPLFVEELLAILVDRAVLRRVRGRWTTAELPALAVPPTIQALIAARIDRLPADERRVLELASIQGTLFEEAAVEALASADLRDTIEAHLRALVRKELIRPRADGEHGYFRHQLVRDAAYESIPKRARAEQHAQFADWLETRSGDGAPELDEIVGHHLETASVLRSQLGKIEGEPELARRASARLASAGRRASAAGDSRAAVSLLARAAMLLPAEAPERAGLVDELQRAADALEALGDERALRRARRVLSAARGDRGPIEPGGP
jgi:DNA-binding SARP family transcriptional activator